MQRKRFIVLSQVALLVVLAVGGLFFYYTRVQATGTTGGLPTDAQAALSHAVDSLRLPSIVVPTNWQVASAQGAAHPDRLPAHGAVPVTASAVWCTRIAPPVMTLATPRTPAITIDHFVVAQVDHQWIAYAVDGVTPSEAQATYTTLGCTNG